MRSTCRFVRATASQMITKCGGIYHFRSFDISNFDGNFLNGVTSNQLDNLLRRGVLGVALDGR